MSEHPVKKNKWQKTAAVVFAFTLMGIGWSYYDGSSETALSLSVQFVKLPPGLVVVGQQPKIDVIMEAPARLVKDLKGPLTYEIDLTGVETGRRLIELSPENITVIQGAKIVDVNPTSFLIQVDTKIEKTVPVVPDFVNEPLSGFVVTSVELTPSAVTLMGPSCVLEKISDLHTTPIDLSDMAAPTKKTVALSIQEGLSVVPAGNSLVQLVMDIREKIVEQTISLPVRCVGTPHNFTIQPERITLLVRGPQNTLEKISQGSDIHVSVDLSGLGPGKYIRPAVIEPPLNTAVLKMEPTKFSIELLKQERIDDPFLMKEEMSTEVQGR